MTTMYGELVRYADGITGEHPYHRPTKFLWSLTIDFDGAPQGLELVPLTTTVQDRKGNEKAVAGASHVTPSYQRASGIDPLLPHDGLGYVLGWCDDSSKPDRIAQAHGAYVALIEEWATSDGINDPIAQALQRFMSSDAPRTIRHPNSWTSKDNLLLSIGSTPAHKAASLPRFWTHHVEQRKGSGATGTCLICGSSGLLVATLPQMIRGPLVPGGQSSGVAPISVNETAFGYNLTTGLAHVPICSTCARAIPTAFNNLLADDGRRHRTESTATTWWIRGESDFDPLDVLEHPDARDIKALISSIESAQQSRVKIEGDQFNCIVVSGNGPRLIVHEWTSIPLVDLQANIAAWFVDTEIQPAWSSESRYTPLWRLATATGRYDLASSRYRPLGDKSGHHSNAIVEELRRAALGGGAPPSQLVTWVLSRVSSDHHVDATRAALLRLVLRRTFSKGTLMPGLDPNCTDTCYVAGRLFAEYSNLQYSAATMDGGTPPNSTFADKNFAGAIANPATAITSGEKQASAWLAKLRRKGWDSVHVRTLDALMELLNPADPLPLRASIEQQAMFVLGYHHQRAHNNHAREAARQKKSEAQPTQTEN